MALMKVIELYTQRALLAVCRFFSHVSLLFSVFRRSPALPFADIEDPHDDNGDHELPFRL